MVTQSRRQLRGPRGGGAAGEDLESDVGISVGLHTLHSRCVILRGAIGGPMHLKNGSYHSPKHYLLSAYCVLDTGAVTRNRTAARTVGETGSDYLIISRYRFIITN